MPLSVALRSNLLRFVEDLLAHMTVAEKRGQLQTEELSSFADRPDRVEDTLVEKLRAGRVGTIVGPRSREEARQLQRIAIEQTRIGIPLLFAAPIDEAAWPSPLAMAASWSPEAVEAVARRTAEAASERGLTWLATPPFLLAGAIRGRGYSGESPFLAQSIRDAVVRGLSGRDFGSDLADEGHALALLRTDPPSQSDPRLTSDRPPFATSDLFAGRDFADWHSGTDTNSEKLDDAVRRILLAKAQLGLFRDPYNRLDAAKPAGSETGDAERIVLARKSMVLLRNEGSTLPLPEQAETVLCVDCGDGLADTVSSALGTAGVSARKLSGLALRQDAIDAPTALFAADGMAIGIASDAASRAQTVLVCIGDALCVEGTGLPRLGEAASALLSALVHANSRCVLLAATARPLDPACLPERLAGHLQTWRPTRGFAEALGAIVTGKAAPSGRLPLSLGQADEPHACPFGHGLSYGALRQTDLSLEFGSDRVSVQVKLHNPHSHAVIDIIQLYVRTPGAPARDLRAFQHVEVPAGSILDIRFELGVEELGQADGLAPQRVAAGRHAIFVGRDAINGQRGEIDIPVDLARAMSVPAALRDTPGSGASRSA